MKISQDITNIVSLDLLQMFNENFNDQIFSNLQSVAITFICCVTIEAKRHIGITLSGVCLSGSHTFLVVTHSYVSQATHAFCGMLPLFTNHFAIILCRQGRLVFWWFVCPFVCLYAITSCLHKVQYPELRWQYSLILVIRFVTDLTQKYVGWKSP